MLPGMAGRPRIAIVGAGNLGTALAVALHRAGYVIDAIIARKASKSRAGARKLARQVNARLLLNLEQVKGQVVWFCVPDAEIARAAASASAKFQAKGKIALHSSGALGSDELDALRDRGAAVASVHPLMTFVRGSRPPLAGVPFAIEGDRKAVQVARQIVLDLGGNPYSIRKKDKAAYHAWGAFTSPLLTALLATAEQVARMAGVDRISARKRMVPILFQTLANYASFGPAGAFSGPIVRGDVETVKRHVGMLRKLPWALDVYLALASSALKILPTKRMNKLQQALRLARTPDREG
jgi:predicted short-subunit dehydrogenase-like oxidoreductase (DUF2520 family)